jgi:oligogalacturonide lyase
MVYVNFRHVDPAGAGGRERRICRLDPATLTSTVLTTMPACSHLMSNHDGSRIVGDGSGDDPYLHLFDLRPGAATVHRRLARHDSSWKVHKGNRQVTHPHPSFTPDQRAVLFTSDRDGEPALYLAELDR